MRWPLVAKKKQMNVRETTNIDMKEHAKELAELKEVNAKAVSVAACEREASSCQGPISDVHIEAEVGHQ